MLTQAATRTTLHHSPHVHTSSNTHHTAPLTALTITVILRLIQHSSRPLEPSGNFSCRIWQCYSFESTIYVGSKVLIYWRARAHGRRPSQASVLRVGLLRLTHFLGYVLCCCCCCCARQSLTCLKVSYIIGYTNIREEHIFSRCAELDIFIYTITPRLYTRMYIYTEHKLHSKGMSLWCAYIHT